MYIIETILALQPSIRNRIGQLVCFEPRYGFWWYRLGESDSNRFLDYNEVDISGAFHIRIRRTFDYEGELRGLVGQVEESGHLFDGLWAATWTMLVGEFDLDSRLCIRWDIELGAIEPEGEWPYVASTSSAYAGHGGVLAASYEAIRHFTRACGQ